MKLMLHELQILHDYLRKNQLSHTTDYVLEHFEDFSSARCSSNFSTNLSKSLKFLFSSSGDLVSCD